MITIGIDASNIISGGGLTHLTEILRALDFKKHNIRAIEVWAPQSTLDTLESKKGLILKKHPLLEGHLVNRIYWQRKVLTQAAFKNYDILLVPGSSYLGSFRPVVTMNRNLLPFDTAERQRYGFSFQALRMLLLEKIQSYTFRSADGVIFLSKTAKQITERKMGTKISETKIIPHGIASKFFQEPRQQKPVDQYSSQCLFHFLYVSTITVYKHQWHVIQAIRNLRDAGYPVVLDLVGNISTKKGRKLFDEARQTYDPGNEFIISHGRKNHTELLNYLNSADGFVFASSCETFGQTLLEAMASGLPIACSDRSAMPEILQDSGLYFDPENPQSIAGTLKKLLDSANLRQKLAADAYQRAATYSWDKCAAETFNFIYNIYKQTQDS